MLHVSRRSTGKGGVRERRRVHLSSQPPLLHTHDAGTGWSCAHATSPEKHIAGRLTHTPNADLCRFVIFVFFLVVLHHTMLVADGMDVDGGDSGPGGMSPSGASPSSGGGEGPGADDYATSLTLLLFWIGTKAFLIGIPLYTVMRIAARQARREQYEAMLRSGALDAAARNVLYRIRARQDALAAGSGAAAAGGSGGRAAPAAAAAPVAAGTV